MDADNQGQRLLDILDRVNRVQRSGWLDRDKRAETLVDAVEMILDRLESVERRPECSCGPED